MQNKYVFLSLSFLPLPEIRGGHGAFRLVWDYEKKREVWEGGGAAKINASWIADENVARKPL